MLAVCGLLTAAPLAVREAQVKLDVPVYSTSELCDPVLARSVLDRLGATRAAPVVAGHSACQAHRRSLARCGDGAASRSPCWWRSASGKRSPQWRGRWSSGRWWTGLATPGTAGLALSAAELAGLALVSAGLVAGERVLAEHLGQGWVNEVRVRLFDHVARTPVREHRRSTGATTLRFVGDLTALRRWASLGLAKLAVAVPLVAGCLVALVLVDPLVAVAVGAVVGAGLAATAVSTPKLRHTNRVAAHVTEHVGQRLVMQAFGRTEAEQRQVGRAGRSLARAMIRRAYAIGLVRGIGEATTLFAAAAALLVATTGGVSAGAAAAALAVVGILVTPLRELSRVAEYRAAAVVATEKITEMLARPVRPARRSPPSRCPLGPAGLSWIASR